MSADAAARLAVIDPEAPDRRIGVAERHVLLALRVRETGGVEVQPEPPLLRPVDPALEVLWPDLTAVDGAVGCRVMTVSSPSRTATGPSEVLCPPSLPERALARPTGTSPRRPPGRPRGAGIPRPRTTGAQERGRRRASAAPREP